MSLKKYPDDLILFGFHAVRAALKNPARTFHALYLTKSAEAELGDLVDRPDLPTPHIVSRQELDHMLSGDTVHQGLAAACAKIHTPKLLDMAEDLVKSGEEPLNFMMLDQVTDPHNVGAVLRSCAAFGVKGLIMQKRNSCPVTGTLAKTAVGALEHVPIFYERNLSEVIKALRDLSFLAVGLDEGGTALKAFPLEQYPCRLLIMGAEGSGLREKTRKYCDQILSLQTYGPISSLNVSVAAGITLYEAAHYNREKTE